MPNRKRVLLRVMTRWARVSEVPPPTTSALEYTETKVQSTPWNYAATGMWARKGAAGGQASAGWLTRFVIPGSTVKHNACYLMLITSQMYMTWLWKVLSPLLPAPTTNEPTNIYWVTALNKALDCPALGAGRAHKWLSCAGAQWGLIGAPLSCPPGFHHTFQ